MTWCKWPQACVYMVDLVISNLFLEHFRSTCCDQKWHQRKSKAADHSLSCALTFARFFWSFWTKFTWLSLNCRCSNFCYTKHFQYFSVMWLNNLMVHSQPWKQHLTKTNLCSRLLTWLFWFCKTEAFIENSVPRCDIMCLHFICHCWLAMGWSLPLNFAQCNF